VAKLIINGVREVPENDALIGRGLPAGVVRVKDAARVETARAGGPRVAIDGLQPDDVLEIELQDGLRVWSRVDDVPRDLVARSARGEAAGDDIELPSALSIGPASRGAGAWAIKALKVIGIDLEGRIAAFVGDHVEGKLQPGPGLYRCSEDPSRLLAPVRSLGGKGPVLLFLHGTASSTAGSFGGLWDGGNGGLAGGLVRQYEGRVLAYQHKTLTESPIRNALELVKKLLRVVGDEAELHLVSHSRGGLIGELLARGMRRGAAPFTPDELALFTTSDRRGDREALEELSRVLASSGLRVANFVRVACPARGTTLADRRLDRYVSTLVNLGSLIPVFRASAVYEGLTNLLAGVLKKRTDPGELPGLEAMMPTSPLVRMLNRPGVRVDSALRILGGDLEGVGLFGRLKTLATDFYYRDDHDLVVNTPAMFGGAERTTPIQYWIDTGGQVTHFHYFTRPETSRRLVAALTGATTDFRTLEERPSAVTSASYAKRAAVSQPVVFVLPGIMGSALRAGDDPVWIDTLELARGGLSRLRPVSGVTPTGLLPDGYGDLCKYLAQTHEVVAFPYDWRLSIDRAAGLLRDGIEGMLPLAEQANQPIRLMAHSMGGLVVRAMLATPKGHATWERLCRHPAARFIMLGTPNGGSHAIVAMLMGRDALVRKLALLDLRNRHNELLATIAGFEGVLNLLPVHGGVDAFDHAVWTKLLDLDAPESRGLFGSKVETSKSAGFRWTLPDKQALKRARDTATRLAASPLDPARVVYVAGVADETACDVELNPGAPAGRRVRVLASARGDGRVLWKTGIPRGVPVFYMDAVHGDLANQARHFPALVDLLNTGTTSKLSTAEPARRSALERFELREAEPAMVPDEAELAADALGGTREKVEQPAKAGKVAVRVVHDNLTNATSPVLVGHYQHDVIVAAEGYLDRRLDGRLSELLKMELYAGPLKTAVVALNEAEDGSYARHPGAVVAGLGQVGDLTPGRLTSTLAQALTVYGAERVGLERRRRQRGAASAPEGGTIPAPVTAILVGSGEGGLTFGDSVQALLRAVLEANERLARPDADARAGGGAEPLTARIDRLDILELYEDRAIEAVHQLRHLASSPEFDGCVIHDMLVEGHEGQRRVRFEQAPDWWQRIRIRSHEKGGLEFEAVTQSARAPYRLQSTQRRLVDGFVTDAIGTTANNPRIGRTLFELLIPNDFKVFAPERRKLALMVDKDAAALPWELLQDGFERSAEPLAVSSGLIRQLLEEQGRPQVMRSPEATALVVGNPIVADTRFPSLAGAADEARHVAKVLADEGFVVELLLERAAHPMAVLSAVHERPWRILHLAAHGVFDFDPGDGQPVSGLVLDDGLFFTAGEAEQMRYVPELVFINCCHLGQTAGDAKIQAFHRLAANLATQFIRMGARAVIAAGWAVDDAAAKTFAAAFYRAILDGRLYGDAVREARQATYAEHGQTNTWGAYQCYGDASFSMAPGRSTRSETPFVAASELCLQLAEIAGRARQDDGDQSGLLDRLNRLETRIPASWWKASLVSAGAAEAFSELGQFERAMRHFERVVTADPALAPVRAVEQLANCRVRWARALLRQEPRVEKEIRGLLDGAETLLGHLLKIGETPERHALLGGAHKARAQAASTAAERTQALKGMEREYKEANRLSPDPYPLVNQIAAGVVLGWAAARPSATSRKAIRALIDEYESMASRAAGSSTQTFSLLAPAEGMLLNALAWRRITDREIDGILAAYERALSRGATARQRDSLRTQFAFFTDMLAPYRRRKWAAELRGQVEKVSESVLQGSM
jgi:tetratricopeptide (TPR) repeat protein